LSIRNLSFIGIFVPKNEVFVVTDEVWQAKARNLLQGELKRRGIKYKELVERLAGIGVKGTVQGVTNKFHRGGFSAVFMLQVLEAIECKKISLGDE
jgi:hypothetical protein